ncbi:hypothetical protein D3C86_1364550 [compost metagenome]
MLNKQLVPESIVLEKDFLYAPVAGTEPHYSYRIKITAGNDIGKLVICRPRPVIKIINRIDGRVIITKPASLHTGPYPSFMIFENFIFF